MEKNWLPNGGDNNDNGDNIYAGMVATLVRSESLCALNGTPDSDSDFSGQERWTMDMVTAFLFEGPPPPTPPPHFTYSRPHIRFRSTLFRCGVRKTMGAGFVDSYFDLCEIVAGVLRPKLRVKGAKMGPAAEGAWCMRPRGLQKKGNK